jgi:hypothetical protein
MIPPSFASTFKEVRRISSIKAADQSNLAAPGLQQASDRCLLSVIRGIELASILG